MKRSRSKSILFLFFVLICSLSFSFCLSSAVFAEETHEIIRIEDMTVVGSPVIEGNEVDRYAGQKTAVTERQLVDLNAQDVGTALRRTPGVNISRYNMVGSFGGGSGGGVFIRGQGTSRPGAEIKTLMDGIPLYMSVWNHPLLDLMSIDTAQSIEVYKSPQPYVFGNAFGVINILPKRKRDEGFETRTEIAAGSYGTFVAKAEHGGRQGNLDYYLGGGYRTSDGHRDNADGEMQDFYGRIGYALGDHLNLSVFTLWNDNYANDPGKEGGDVADREGRYETRTWVSAVTLENEFDMADGYVKLYHSGGEGDWLDQPTSDPDVREDLFNDFLFYGIKARERIYPWSGGEIIVGLDWDVCDGEYDQKFTDGTTDRWEGHDFTILSPYIAVSHQFGSKEGFYAIPSAGVRYYDNSDFDAEDSPHAGLVLGYKQTQLHVGYSRGVIYPGLEVVVFSEKVIPMLGSSWEDLNPEIVDHYEVGLSHHFGSHATVDITWFYDDGKDRYVIAPPPPPPPVYANIEEYRIQGVETTICLYPKDNLSLFGGLTYLDADPSDLPYAPELTVSAGMNWTFLKKFKLSLDCEYLDDMFVDAQLRNTTAQNTQTVDSYFLMNGKISYTFTPEAFGSTVEVFLAGENLSDESYEYLPGYPMPGITGMAGIICQF